MKSMNGKLQQKSLSKVFQINFTGIAEVFFILILGFTAMLIHSRVKLGLHIPGHHGFEFMAMILIAKLVTQFRLSGTLFSLGTISILLFPILGFTNPLAALTFAIPGIIFDIFSNFIKKKKGYLLFYALFAGISYSTIPIIRIILSMNGVFLYKTLIFGAFYPIFSHFCFALFGAFTGIGLFFGIKKIINIISKH